MPRISHEQKQLYKAKIRALMSRDHLAPQRELQLKLEADGLHLDRNYLGKLMNEIYTERAMRADRMMLNSALAVFQDTMTETMHIAWEIALDPFTKRTDQLAAIREIREAHNDVFDKLFDAGIFDRKRGSLEMVIRNTPLTEEKKKSIREVFTNWGLIPAKEDAPPAEPSLPA